MTEALVTALSAAGGATVAVEGPAGFGKTTLAVRACGDPRVVDRFPGGVLWTTVGESRQGGELAELVAGLCEVLSGELVHTTDPLVAGGRLGSLLDAHEPILLVVDDVWTPAQLAPFLVGGDGSRRMVTTRNAGVVPRSSTTVLVDRMTPAQAATVLTDGVSDVPDDVIGQLLTTTGRWPLLLSLVNATLIEHLAAGAGIRAAVAWMLKHLAAAGPAAFDRDLGDRRDRSQAVESTMAASLDLLTQQERARLFELAIVPDDTVVPARVLERLWKVGGGLSEPAVERLRALLVRLRLLTEVWTDAGPAVRMHDVVRSYLAHQQSTEGLRATHGLMVDAARDLLPGSPGPEPRWWTLPAEPWYLWRYLPHHLAAAGRVTERDALVCDLRWVAAKTHRAGSSVPAEVDLADVSMPPAAALRQVLARTSQQLTIAEPENALAATLYAYLGGVPELAQLVTEWGDQLTEPQLVPVGPLPDAPGSGTYRDIAGHDLGVSGCAFSPDGAALATASYDRTVRLWSTATGEQRHILGGAADGVTGCAFSPDGRLVAGAVHDGTIHLWDTTDGARQRVLTGPGAGITGCAFSPDGAVLGAAGGDGSVWLWQPATGVQVRVLAGHEGAVRACAFSPDGTLVASAGEDGTVRLWDAAAGEPFRVLTGHEGTVHGCAFSPDGTLLASAGSDGTVRLWDAVDGTEVDVLTGHAEAVTGCAFSPDGVLVAAGGHDCTVRVWHVATGSQRNVFAGHTEGVSGCAFSPDSTLLASAGFDWHLRLWQVGDGHAPAAQARRWVYGGTFAAHGDLLLTSGHDRKVVLQERSTGAVVRSLEGHTDTVAACAVSPDGWTIASAGHDATVRLWDGDTGVARAVLTGHTDVVHDCAFDPSGSVLASVGHDETTRLWAPDGTPGHVLLGHDGPVAACAFSPDGTLLVTASHDLTLRLWEVGTGRVRAVLEGHTDIVTGCAFTADGRQIASTSHDRTVRVWNVRSGRPRLTLTGHTGGVSACAYAPDGSILASAGYDRQVRVWDAHSYRQLCALRVAAPLLRLAWDPNRPEMLLTGEAGSYLLRYLPTGVGGQ